ncbi:T4SS efffector SepA family protein [Litoreibacter arenae]|uniref:T4SS efffector SepA family protein n=1 Tax=Litoreibacter arenae TaxID=491388 RepID=UPI000594365D|nr:hypothetical protein [Litoreibacter arenae]
MPNIEISDADFLRLQAIAVPLVDTPASVVSGLLDMHESQTIGGEKPKNVQVYGFDSPPPLVHVKFISGMIGLHQPEKQNWDSMVNLSVKLTHKQEKSVERLAKILDLNITDGFKDDEGYKYLPDLKLSYQGVSAKHAAKVIGNAARFLNEDARVDFVWRQKDGAFAPGQVAALSYEIS